MENTNHTHPSYIPDGSGFGFNLRNFTNSQLEQRGVTTGQVNQDHRDIDGKENKDPKWRIRNDQNNGNHNVRR